MKEYFNSFLAFNNKKIFFKINCVGLDSFLKYIKKANKSPLN